MQQSRQTAFKLWLYDIKNSKYFKENEELKPNYILFKGNKISRVNIIANVVMKFENVERNYSSITLDDGSAIIKVKCWKEDVKILDNINIGSIVLLVGRIREFNTEIYIAPEIIRDISYEWALVRKLELEKIYGKPETKFVKEAKKEPINNSHLLEEVVENSPNENNRQKILILIEKFDSEEGAETFKVIEESKIEKEEANKIIGDLLKDGEIFQSKAGKLKSIN